MQVTVYVFPSPSAPYGEIRKMYDTLRIKKRFDSVTPEEQDWMDWAESHLDQQQED